MIVTDEECDLVERLDDLADRAGLEAAVDGGADGAGGVKGLVVWEAGDEFFDGGVDDGVAF